LLTELTWLSYAVDVLPVESTATMSNAAVLVLFDRSAANGGPSIPNSPSHDPFASMFKGGVINSTRLLLDVDHDGALFIEEHLSDGTFSVGGGEVYDTLTRAELLQLGQEIVALADGEE
jgi:hypothetical protein